MKIQCKNCEYISNISEEPLEKKIICSRCFYTVEISKENEFLETPEEFASKLQKKGFSFSEIQKKMFQMGIEKYDIEQVLEKLNQSLSNKEEKDRVFKPLDSQEDKKEEKCSTLFQKILGSLFWVWVSYVASLYATIPFGSFLNPAYESILDIILFECFVFTILLMFWILVKKSVFLPQIKFPFPLHLQINLKNFFLISIFLCIIIAIISNSGFRATCILLILLFSPLIYGKILNYVIELYKKL